MRWISLASVAILVAVGALAVLRSENPKEQPVGIAESMSDLTAPDKETDLSAVRSTTETRKELDAAGIPNPSNASYEGKECGSATASFSSGDGPVTLILRGSSRFHSIHAAEPGRTDSDGSHAAQSTSLPMERRLVVPNGNFGELSAQPLYGVYEFRPSSAGHDDTVGRAAIFAGYCYTSNLS
ncbi:hypothetical protein [Streptomyces sparsus]